MLARSSRDENVNMSFRPTSLELMNDLDIVIRPQEESFWYKIRHPKHKYMLWFFVLEIVSSIIVALIQIIFAVMDNSSLFLSASLQNLIGVGQFALLIWRFSPKQLGGSYCPEREARVCFVIALLIMISAFVVIIFTINNLVHEDKPQATPAFIAFAVLLFVESSISCLVMIYFAYHFREKSIRIMMVDLCLISIMDLGALISALVNHEDSSYWWFDCIMSFVVSAILIAFALYSAKSYPFMDKSFWLSNSNANLPENDDENDQIEARLVQDPDLKPLDLDTV